MKLVHIVRYKDGSPELQELTALADRFQMPRARLIRGLVRLILENQETQVLAYNRAKLVGYAPRGKHAIKKAPPSE